MCHCFPPTYDWSYDRSPSGLFLIGPTENNATATTSTIYVRKLVIDMFCFAFYSISPKAYSTTIYMYHVFKYFAEKEINEYIAREKRDLPPDIELTQTILENVTAEDIDEHIFGEQCFTFLVAD